MPYLCLENPKISENLHIKLEKNSKSIKISSNNLIPKLATTLNTRPQQFEVVNQVLYWVENGQWLAAPLNDFKSKKVLKRLDHWYEGTGAEFTPTWMHKKFNNVLMAYRQGGASMGTSYFFSLKDAYTLKEGYKVSDKLWVDCDEYSAMKLYNQGKNIPLDTPYIYNQIHFWNDQMESGGYSDDMTLVGKTLYLSAIKGNDPYSKIVGIDTETGRVNEITNREMTSFDLEGGSLAYISEKTLYWVNLTTLKEKQWSLEALADPYGVVKVCGESIYLSSKGQLYRYSESTPEKLNEKGNLWSFEVVDGYLIATFEETPENPYRMLCFNSAGKLVYKTSDYQDMERISVDNHVLYYLYKDTKSLYQVILN